MNSVRLLAGRGIAMELDRNRNLAPRRDRLHEASDPPLQNRRPIAQVGRLSDRRVDHGIKRNNAPQEVASTRLKLVQVAAGGHKTIGEPIHDRARQGCAFRCELSSRVSEIGEREHDARGDNADANLQRSIDGEDEDDSVRASDRPKHVDRNNRRGIAGERRGIGRKIG